MFHFCETCNVLVGPSIGHDHIDAGHFVYVLTRPQARACLTGQEFLTEALVAA